jgi:hypothetical protein
MILRSNPSVLQPTFRGDPLFQLLNLVARLSVITNSANSSTAARRLSITHDVVRFSAREHDAATISRFTPGRRARSADSRSSDSCTGAGQAPERCRFFGKAIRAAPRRRTQPLIRPAIPGIWGWPRPRLSPGQALHLGRARRSRTMRRGVSASILTPGKMKYSRTPSMLHLANRLLRLTGTCGSFT